MRHLNEALSKSMIKKIDKHGNIEDTYYLVIPRFAIVKVFKMSFPNYEIETDDDDDAAFLVAKKYMKLYLRPENKELYKVYEIKKHYDTVEELEQEYYDGSMPMFCEIGKENDYFKRIF